MGSVNLDNTGSGSAITLSSDGTNLLLDGTAIGGGGGGADLYAANESSPSAQPSATGTNAIAIGDSAVASGTRSTALGYLSNASGSGSVALGMGRSSGGTSFSAVIDNEFSGGALNAGSIAIGNTARANASYATAIGRNSISTALYSIAIGYNSNASHNYSIALGENITSTAAYQINIGGSTQDVRISETYTLPKVDGTASGQVLTTDGSGTVSWAAAGGGGGSPDLLAENPVTGTNAPVASGTDAVAIGFNTTATGSKSFAIGLGDGDATGTNSFAAGGQATNSNAIAIANGSSAQGYNSVSIGSGSRAQGTRAVALGSEAKATTNSNAIAIGTSLASGASSFAAAITNNTTSYGASSTKGISIGPFSQTLTGQNVISIGYASIGSGGNSTAVGYRNQATNTNAVALGSHARATGYYSLAISSANGDSEGALSSGIGSIAIGRTVTASHQDSAVLGNDVQSTATNQVSIGGSTQDVRISEVYTLPKVDGTASGQVLTTDGSGAVSWATPSGGGSMNLISTQNISSAVSSIDFTSLGSYTRWKIIGSYKWSSGAIAALKLFDNGSLISGSQYSSYRTKDYDTPAIFNGAYGFLANNIGIQNASFIWDIIMVDGRPYVKMDTSGQASSSHASQEQCNTSGMLVDSYSLTSLTGFSVTATGGTCNTGQISLYGIST